MGLGLTSILFFFHIYLLGFSVLKLTKTPIQKENFFLRMILNILVGFSVLNILPFLLGLIGIPMHILAITISSCVLFAIALFQLNKNNELQACLVTKNDFRLRPYTYKWKEKTYIIGILVLIILSTAIYFTGTFKTNHLEDGDPWTYACLADYIATEKTYFVEDDFNCGVLNVYLKPIPRRLTVLFGLYAQTNESIQGTMKYLFNYFLLIGTIGFILLFYFFFERDVRKTFFATLFIISAPSFIGRFTFENNLGLLLLAGALIPIIKIVQGEKKWWIVGGITLGAQVISQPSTSIFSIGFILLTLLFLIIHERKQITTKQLNETKSLQIVYAGLLAVLLLIIFFIQPILMYGTLNIPQEGLPPIKFGPYIPEKTSSEQMKWIKEYNPSYNLKTLAVAQKTSRMDQPTGFGVALFIFMILSLCIFSWKTFSEKNNLLKKVVLINFIITTIILIFGWKTNIALFSSRFWPIVTMYGAILFGFSTGFIFEHIRKISYRILLVLIILISVYFTSFVQDAAIQSGAWPQHRYDPVYAQTGYDIIFSQLPLRTKVFPICKDGKFLLGLDKNYNYKGYPHDEYLKTLPSKTSFEIVSYLKTIDYQYFTIESDCIEKIGLNKTNEVIGLLLESKYEITYKNDGFLLLKRPNKSLFMN